MKINLDAEDIERCFSFCKEFISKKAGKSDLDFGNVDLNRKEIDRLVDCASGKIGERAFQKFCKEHGIDIELDYTISDGRLNIDDGQDIALVEGKKPIIRYDIKGSKSFAQWLLIEEHKADEEIIKADIYIFMRTELPGDIEQNINSFPKDRVKSEFSGYIFYEDLFDSEGNPWFHFGEGSRLLKRFFVKDLYSAAKAKFGKITSKNQIKEIYQKIIKNEQDIFMNIWLKAKSNFGLPLDFLRKSKDDVMILMDILKKDSILNEVIADRELIMRN